MWGAQTRIHNEHSTIFIISVMTLLKDQDLNLPTWLTLSTTLLNYMDSLGPTTSTPRFRHTSSQTTNKEQEACTLQWGFMTQTVMIECFGKSEIPHRCWRHVWTDIHASAVSLVQQYGKHDKLLSPKKPSTTIIQRRAMKKHWSICGSILNSKSGATEWATKK